MKAELPSNTMPRHSNSLLMQGVIARLLAAAGALALLWLAVVWALEGTP